MERAIARMCVSFSKNNIERAFARSIDQTGITRLKHIQTYHRVCHLCMTWPCLGCVERSKARLKGVHAKARSTDGSHTNWCRPTLPEHVDAYVKQPCKHGLYRLT